MPVLDADGSWISGSETVSPQARLAAALKKASPRFNPKPTPLPSLLIHGGALAFWLVLTAMALFGSGIVAWSIGLAYILYDTALILLVTYRIWPLWHREATSVKPPADHPDICVVIAARNEASTIVPTVDALRAQTDPPEAIIIADDGSDDDMGAVLVRQYGLSVPAAGMLSAPAARVPNLRWLRLAPGGKARALNAALVHVREEIVVTVDADTILAPDAIAAMRRAFAVDPDLVVGGGVLAPVCDGSPSGRLFQFFQTYEYVRNVMSRYAWGSMNSLLLVSGAFTAIRRKALLAVGGFDPACLTEDYELTHRIHRHAINCGLNWHVRILGSAHARTAAPAHVLAFLRQRRRWFTGFLQTQYWNRDMVGNARYRALGLVMLPIKALDTVQPVYGLTAALLVPIFIASGRGGLLVPVFGVTLAKIALDLSFYILSIVLYRRWTGLQDNVRIPDAILSAMAEPFCFQILRQAGAAWGWLSFLSRDRRWRH